MNDTSRYVAAALSAGAGVLHFVAAGMHLGSGIDVAVFTAAGWTQLALAAALVVRPSRSVAFAIVAVSVACIGAWAASRTVGLPWGEHRDVVESVGATDLLATTFEAGVVIALLAPVRVTSARNAAFSGLVALIAVGGLTTAVAATRAARPPTGMCTTRVPVRRVTPRRGTRTPVT